MIGGNNKERVFFALWPDKDTRKALAERARVVHEIATEGRPIPEENLHVTLRFLGSISRRQRKQAAAAARRIRRARFSLRFDRAGFWPQSKVAWLGCSDLPDPLLSLVADLNTELGSEGFDLYTRPYRPHVTVLRGVGELPELPAIEPLDWEPERFVLVRSRLDESGSSYRVLDEWPLDAPAPES